MISCLCVTHDRHEFMPWVEHQFLKQKTWGGYKLQVDPLAELLILDSSERPWESEFATVHHCPTMPGIAEKRTLAIKVSRPMLTWFDDDDWQSPTKVNVTSRMWDEEDDNASGDFSAFGARHAYMYSVSTGRASIYESTYEPIIFNSAVYRKNSVPQNFDSTRITGEDTEWCERWLQTRPSYVTLGEPTHAWLCHGKNVTNKDTSRFFELANPIPFDDWEREFLERLRKGG
jgi:hypothetical protein